MKMESLDFYYAHDEGKSVWSHCIVTTHIVSGDSSYALDFRNYFREEYCKAHSETFKSKNDLAIEMIQAYEAEENESVYVLMDSWFTSKKLIDLCNSKGFHVIAAVKMNRIIYRCLPNKARIFRSNHCQRLSASIGTQATEGNLNLVNE